MGPAKNAESLLLMETAHQILEVYIWLSFRFADRFPERELATSECNKCASLISQSLGNFNDKDAVRTADAVDTSMIGRIAHKKKRRVSYRY